MNLYSLLSSFFIIAGAFALLILLILIALLIKHKSVGRSVTLSSLRNFILCFFCIILLYYFTSYKGIHTGVFQRGIPGRIADFSLFILLDYFWFAFVRAHLKEMGKARPIFDKAVNGILAGLLVLSVFCGVVLIDANYYVADPAARIFAIGIESLCCLTGSVLNMVYMVQAVKAGLEKQTQLFVVIVSILVFGVGLLSGIATVRLAVGEMAYAVESFYYDPTSLIMILTAFCVLVYLFRHDFSPIYFMEQAEEELTDEEVLDLLAQECGLSKREREVCELIFKGDSYEDIAEQLYISKLTVKKHVHNLYEKLDVSKRMDLINLVRARKIQEKTK